MALARFKDLCMDATGDTARLGAFWAEVLGFTWVPQEDGDGELTGPTPEHTIWINRVPEPKSVKHRVHLDVYCRRLADLEALGSPVILPAGDGRNWTVMTDPEGGEFCAFVRDEVPADRLHGLVVDSADPVAQANWWGRVYGADVVHQHGLFSTVEHVPGMPILTMDFTFVPEEKEAKNRVHWDVWVPDLTALIQEGATMLAPAGPHHPWYVMADPEGNEFCAWPE